MLAGHAVGGVQFSTTGTWVEEHLVLPVLIGLAFSACGHDIGAGLVRIGRFMARPLEESTFGCGLPVATDGSLHSREGLG
jgi:hypothetical protein